MAMCRKCNTVNEDGLTRCKACNGILPVKLGSKSENRWERTRRQADLVGTKCPACETVNPYTIFKCKSCGHLLSKKAKRSGFDIKVWLSIGFAVAVLVSLIAAAMRGG